MLFRLNMELSMLNNVILLWPTELMMFGEWYIYTHVVPTEKALYGICLFVCFFLSTLSHTGVN